jgi:hypothetical protein
MGKRKLDFSSPSQSGEKETTEHGVTLVDAPLLLDEGFGLEEVSLTTLLELAELKPNADNLVNLDCDGNETSVHFLCTPK